MSTPTDQLPKNKSEQDRILMPPPSPRLPEIAWLPLEDNGTAPCSNAEANAALLIAYHWQQSLNNGEIPVDPTVVGMDAMLRQMEDQVKRWQAKALHQADKAV